MGRATPSLVKSVIIVLFQSTPSVGRATALPDPPKKSIEISIHALRGEGDYLTFRSADISRRYFNPRPPWGGRPRARFPRPALPFISIHALRGEGDVRHRRQVEFCRLFQSTPSVGRATSPADVFFSRRTFQSTPSVGRATHSF